jgi:hypothetical protein
VKGEDGSGGGTTENTKREMEKKSMAVVGHPWAKFCHSTMTDKAAISLADAFGHEKDPCGMHQNMKVTGSSAGSLVRSKNKQVVNAFAAGHAVVAKAKAQCNHFASGTRRDDVWDMGAKVEGGVPKRAFQNDLNTTRAASTTNMCYSVLLLHNGCNALAAKEVGAGRGRPSWAMEPEDYERLADMEGVFQVTGKVTTLVQSEKCFMGAYGRLLIEDMLKTQRSGSLPILDYAAVTEANVAHPPQGHQAGGH